MGSPSQPQRHSRVAFLPFVSVCLKTEKPTLIPKNPKTLGEHLLKRRLKLGLLQRAVAAEIGVTNDTILNWEHDQVEPENRYWPAIIRFLGFDPIPASTALGEQMVAYRRRSGLSRRGLADRLGFDEATIRRWEEGTAQPDKRRRTKLNRLIGPTNWNTDDWLLE